MFKEIKSLTSNLRYLSLRLRLIGISVFTLILFWYLQNVFGIFYKRELNVVSLKPMPMDVPRPYEDWSPGMDFLPEKEAFNDKYIIKSKRQAAKDINVKLRGGKVKYSVGDDIFVDLTVFDYNGKQRTIGGDNIRVRMADTKNDAYSSGYVLDHRNGSYTAVLKALWKGTPTIYVKLAFTREEIVYLYQLRRKFPTLRTMVAIYKDGITYESCECLPFPKKFEANNGFCNLTSFNAGHPWFCQMPTKNGLTCADFSSIVLSKMEKNTKTIMYSQLWKVKRRPKEIVINVKDVPHSETKRLQLQPCTEYDRMNLWRQRSPVGFFHNGTLLFSHCISTRKSNPLGCFSGKTVFLYGDSTLRQWYYELIKRTNCVVDEAFEKANGDWLCRNREKRLNVHLVRHNLPGNVNNKKWTVKKDVYWALEDLLDLVEEGTQPLFVVHLFSHYAALHHRHYIKRIKELRKSIDLILEKRKDAMVLIKGPHTFTSKFRKVCDYYGYVYRAILIKEFEGLHEKVVYLDYKDMSIAKQVADIHPKPSFVNSMVDAMLAYVC